MENQDYNKAENAVDRTQNRLNDYAEQVKSYIREQKANNQEPTQEGWYENLKSNINEAWDDVKDTASEAWEKTKDFAVDVEAEIKKKTN